MRSPRSSTSRWSSRPGARKRCVSPIQTAIGFGSVCRVPSANAADAPLLPRCESRTMAQPPPKQVDALERAVAACRQALVDYQSGLFDEEQLRRALFRDGLVLGDCEAWFLDVAAGAWHRYDGITTDALPALPGDGSATRRAFDTDTLRRWQRGL